VVKAVKMNGRRFHEESLRIVQDTTL
jgi:hypothetical protein